MVLDAAEFRKDNDISSLSTPGDLTATNIHVHSGVEQVPLFTHDVPFNETWVSAWTPIQTKKNTQIDYSALHFKAVVGHQEIVYYEVCMKKTPLDRSKSTKLTDLIHPHSPSLLLKKCSALQALITIRSNIYLAVATRPRFCPWFPVLVIRPCFYWWMRVSCVELCEIPLTRFFADSVSPGVSTQVQHEPKRRCIPLTWLPSLTFSKWKRRLCSVCRGSYDSYGQRGKSGSDGMVLVAQERVRDRLRRPPWVGRQQPRERAREPRRHCQQWSTIDWPLPLVSLSSSIIHRRDFLKFCVND